MSPSALSFFLRAGNYKSSTFYSFLNSSTFNSSLLNSTFLASNFLTSIFNLNSNFLTSNLTSTFLNIYTLASNFLASTFNSNFASVFNTSTFAFSTISTTTTTFGYSGVTVYSGDFLFFSSSHTFLTFSHTSLPMTGWTMGSLATLSLMDLLGGQPVSSSFGMTLSFFSPPITSMTVTTASLRLVLESLTESLALCLLIVDVSSYGDFNR